mmetsp:Transcript_2842/g.10321  ORF Transcript_2842/g.10321 Transcript_2842/m.10321 type:complete len:213 (+) Transcript_2842:83-721(+)|eukprot:scaffold2360_cov380-Prasinococcus_capsulatus_cf.AAC.19
MSTTDSPPPGFEHLARTTPPSDSAAGGGDDNAVAGGRSKGSTHQGNEDQRADGNDDHTGTNKNVEHDVHAPDASHGAAAKNGATRREEDAAGGERGKQTAPRRRVNLGHALFREVTRIQRDRLEYEAALQQVAQGDDTADTRLSAPAQAAARTDAAFRRARSNAASHAAQASAAPPPPRAAAVADDGARADKVRTHRRSERQHYQPPSQRDQ